MIQQKVVVSREKILLVLLILISISLRIPSLDLGLWRDEASTYFDSIPNNFTEIIDTVAYTELNPPIFYLVMHQWMQWFGEQEIIFKIPALIFGTLLIPSTYILGNLARSPKAGLIAAAMATFAQDSVNYSQEARPYTLAALLICWITLLYCKALAKTKNQTWYLIGFTICLSILMYVQYTGILLSIALVIITLYLIFNRTIGNAIPFALAFGTVFLLFIPWLSIFITHLNTGTPWTVKEPFLTVFYENISYPLLNPKKVSLLLVMLGLGVTLSKLFQKKSNARTLSLSPEVYTVILGACFLCIVAMQAIFSHKGRYVFPFASIAWAFYGSCLLSLARFSLNYANSNWAIKWQSYLKQVILISATILLILFVFLQNRYDLHIGNVDKSGIRALAKSWESRLDQKKTLYILSPDYLAPTFGYYFLKHPVPFYGFARWDRPEIFSPQNYAEIWASPTLLADTERRLQEELSKGYRQLALITESSDQSDLGKMRYSRTNQLLDILKRRYPLLEKTDYLGLSESVSLYLFDINQST